MVERQRVQREEDRAVFSTIDRLTRFLDAVPKISLLFTLLVGVVAWFGAQAGAPKKVTDLGVKVDSGFRSADKRFQSLESIIDEDRKARSRLDDKVDLLLRIGCPTITRFDLVKDCRDLGVAK